MEPADPNAHANQERARQDAIQRAQSLQPAMRPWGPPTAILRINRVWWMTAPFGPLSQGGKGNLFLALRTRHGEEVISLGFAHQRSNGNETINREFEVDGLYPPPPEVFCDSASVLPIDLIVDGEFKLPESR